MAFVYMQKQKKPNCLILSICLCPSLNLTLLEPVKYAHTANICADKWLYCAIHANAPPCSQLKGD